MIPGEIIPADAAPLAANTGLSALTLDVTNTGDRPIQVGSHFHFAETNSALRFDRAVARGFRLDIPAGTAVRFEAATPNACNSSRSPARVRSMVSTPR